MLNDIQRSLLKAVAGYESVRDGAYNIRSNGGLEARNTTANIDIVTKTDKPGIDIIIKPNTVGERVDIPVLITKTGLKDLVYNDFYIGENSDVLIVAGCGINNCGDDESRHDGIHSFHIGKNASVKYIEKHYGGGSGRGGRVMNPTTEVEIDEGGRMEMDTMQIEGVDDTYRTTRAVLKKNATLTIHEKILTTGTQSAVTDFSVDMNGEDSGVHLVSRSVAKDNSKQKFISLVNGNTRCTGHTECDAIIMDNGQVSAIPKINAYNVDARLIHEAAIGKIAGEQLNKLMTLGLSKKEAEQKIINGFIK